MQIIKDSDSRSFRTSHAPLGITAWGVLLVALTTAQHESLYWAFYKQEGAQAVRKGHWKAVQQPYHSPIRLYDLSTDIGERKDLASDHPKIVAEMQQLMIEANTPSDRWKFPKPLK